MQPKLQITNQHKLFKTDQLRHTVSFSASASRIKPKGALSQLANRVIGYVTEGSGGWKERAARSVYDAVQKAGKNYGVDPANYFSTLEDGGPGYSELDLSQMQTDLKARKVKRGVQLQAMVDFINNNGVKKTLSKRERKEAENLERSDLLARVREKRANEEAKGVSRDSTAQRPARQVSQQDPPADLRRASLDQNETTTHQVQVHREFSDSPPSLSGTSSEASLFDPDVTSPKQLLAAETTTQEAQTDSESLTSFSSTASDTSFFDPDATSPKQRLADQYAKEQPLHYSTDFSDSDSFTSLSDLPPYSSVDQYANYNTESNGFQGTTARKDFIGRLAADKASKRSSLLSSDNYDFRTPDLTSTESDQSLNDLLDSLRAEEYIYSSNESIFEGDQYEEDPYYEIVDDNSLETNLLFVDDQFAFLQNAQPAQADQGKEAETGKTSLKKVTEDFFTSSRLRTRRGSTGDKNFVFNGDLADEDVVEILTSRERFLSNLRTVEVDPYDGSLEADLYLPITTSEQGSQTSSAALIQPDQPPSVSSGTQTETPPTSSASAAVQTASSQTVDSAAGSDQPASASSETQTSSAAVQTASSQTVDSAAGSDQPPSASSETQTSSAAVQTASNQTVDSATGSDQPPSASSETQTSSAAVQTASNQTVDSAAGSDQPPSASSETQTSSAAVQTASSQTVDSPTQPDQPSAVSGENQPTLTSTASTADQVSELASKTSEASLAPSAARAALEQLVPLELQPEAPVVPNEAEAAKRLYEQVLNQTSAETSDLSNEQWLQFAAQIEKNFAKKPSAILSSEPAEQQRIQQDLRRIRETSRATFGRSSGYNFTNLLRAMRTNLRTVPTSTFSRTRQGTGGRFTLRNLPGSRN